MHHDTLTQCKSQIFLAVRLLTHSAPHGSLSYGGALFTLRKNMMKFGHESIVSVSQFDREGIEILFALAHRMRKIENREVQCNVLGGYILGSLFFESSTRTRMSFDAAFMRLGGTLNSTVGFAFSSLAKGETLEDTIRVVSGYCDLIVIRHPDEGSAAIAASCASKPVINAGDGPGEHPTQALLDLFTIFEERKHVDGITIAMVGDLKHGRTVHSLAKLLTLYGNIHLVCIAPPEVQIPEELTAILTKRGCKVTQTSHLQEWLPQLDVIYMTRVQKERFADTAIYDRVNGSYVLDRNLVETHCKPDVTIMHPLPRMLELSTDLDTFPGSAYFRQAENGTLVRMALFLLVLGKESKFV